MFLFCVYICGNKVWWFDWWFENGLPLYTVLIVQWDKSCCKIILSTPKRSYYLKNIFYHFKLYLKIHRSTWIEPRIQLTLWFLCSMCSFISVHFMPYTSLFNLKVKHHSIAKITLAQIKRPKSVLYIRCLRWITWYTAVIHRQNTAHGIWIREKRIQHGLVKFIHLCPVRA